MLTAIRNLGIWCFAFVDIINWTLLSLIVVGYSTFNLSMLIFILLLGNEPDIRAMEIDSY